MVMTPSRRRLPALGGLRGNGVPISEALLQDEFAVYGVDASKTLMAKFRQRFPDVTVECSCVEESSFFNGTFDAVLAWA
jgi:hypothetical protein